MELETLTCDDGDSSSFVLGENRKHFYYFLILFEMVGNDNYTSVSHCQIYIYLYTQDQFC